MLFSSINQINILLKEIHRLLSKGMSNTYGQSLILHKMLTLTGTLNLSRFRENWDVAATNEFHRA